MARKPLPKTIVGSSDQQLSSPGDALMPDVETTYTTSKRKSNGGNRDIARIKTGTKPKTETSDSKRISEFLTQSLDRFRSIADDQNEIEIRDQALKELKFYNGDQWPDEIKRIRTTKKRPIVTINKVKPAVQIICNDQRQNRSSIKVAPMDGLADIKTARIFQGAIRHIEVNSMSDIAVDNACKPQVIHGFGYIRLKIDYASPFSMDQEIFIASVKDPFSVYCGASSEPDYSDMDDCFITEDLTPEQFRQVAPHSYMSSATEYTGIGDSHRGWGTRDKIRVCERFWRTFEKKKLVRLSNGQDMLEESIPQEWMNEIGIMKDSNDQPMTRETEVPTVHWCKFTAVEIIEAEQIWPGMYIPIIPVLGDDTIIDGKRYLSGVVKNAMDPSMQYNYFRSLMTETLGLAPKAPYIMAEGQNENRQTMWDSANSENYSVLFYKPISLNGQLAPPPQRQQSEPPIQAMVEAAVHYESDIKATTMVNDAKLGARSNETSGAAINARKAQSDVSNFSYIDNRDRAIRHVGRQCIDLIPKVYSSKTIMRIIGEDEQPEMVNVINDPTQKAYTEEVGPSDIKKIYNLGVGQYDVAIGVGQPYMSRRAEAFDLMTNMVNSRPELMEVIGDLIFKNSDIPGAQEIAARMRLALPDKLKPESGKETIPPNIKAAFDAMQQQISAMTEVNHKLQQMLESDAVKSRSNMLIKQMDVDSKNHQAEVKADTEMAAITEKWLEAKLKAATDAQSTAMDQKFAMLQTAIQGMLTSITSAQTHQQNSALSAQDHGQTIEQQDQQGAIDHSIASIVPPAPTPTDGAAV